jgi:hypothetical protein
MEHQTFDRLTRLFGTAASRRSAWRALLASALLGVTTRSVAAEPCDNVRNSNSRCTCGETSTCEPGKCFTHDCGHQRCCTAEHKLVICGNECCMTETERGVPIADPCRVEVSGKNRLPNCVRPNPPAPRPGAPPAQAPSLAATAAANVAPSVTILAARDSNLTRR